MFKKVVAIASVAALLATATPAFAHGYGYRHEGHGDNAGLIAFGAIAGLMLGAAIASSHNDAPPPVAYAPPPAYYPAPTYYAPAPAYYAPAPAYYAPAPAYYGYPQ